MKMIKTYQNINQIDGKQWNDLTNHSSHRSAFQTPECHAFYDSLSFMEAFVFGVSEDDVLKGVIVGFVIKDGGKIKQFLSRRAIINGGPLLADDISEEALAALLDTCVKSLKSKAIYVESRNLSDYSAFKKVFENCGFAYEPHLGYVVDTSSEDEMIARIEKRRMQSVRSALKNGVSIVEHPTLEELSEFYVLLEDLYKTRVKTPLYPKEFFEKLLATDFGLALLLKYEDKIIGGQISLCLKGYGVYDLFMTGDDMNYKKLRPSTLATYSGMQYAAQNGYGFCDLMGAGKPGQKYGVRDFKASFGGNLVEYGRYHYLCHPLLFAIGKAGVWVLKHLK